MASESETNRLPFEPAKKRKKPPAKTKPTAAVEKPEKASATKETKSEQGRRLTKEEMAIPKVVSDRMARRAALFSGTPTFLGVAIFFVSYYIVSHGWFKLPNVAVLLVSMGFFGLGVLGLTYGILSASWDEERVGGLLGWQEFKVNLGRMVSAWRSSRQKNV
jgi:hypothetical protein